MESHGQLCKLRAPSPRGHRHMVATRKALPGIWQGTACLALLHVPPPAFRNNWEQGLRDPLSISEMGF